MLTELSVRNLGTVKSATVPFASGLTVLAGETGSGKSLLLNSLKLSLGGRVDNKLIRHGCERLDVDAIWHVTTPGFVDQLEELGAKLDESELYVNRFIEAGGKARITLGGKAVPAGTVKELAGELIEIHGQAEQLRLKDSAAQRDILDSFGGDKLASALQAYKLAYKEWRALKKQLKELEENSLKHELELRYKEELVARFEELAPQIGELAETEEAIARLSHIEAISEELKSVDAIINAEEWTPPVAALSEALRAINRIAAYDPKLAVISEAFESKLDELEETLDEIVSYAENLDEDSIASLHRAEDRLQELKIFVKPFGGDLERAIEEALKAQQELEHHVTLTADELQAEVKLAEDKLTTLSGQLTIERKATATKLQQAVNAELVELAMKGTELAIAVDESSFNPYGADEVSFQVATHGKNPSPLMKAASGGELSRIMLSLELVLAAQEARKTFVFDEVDAGVGGATALEIGKKLAQLAKKHQVIVVSHLAQVASFADSIVQIAKEDTGSEVFTTVEELTTRESTIKELARMLSGMNESKSGLDHAEELLSNAEAFKQEL